MSTGQKIFGFSKLHLTFPEETSDKFFLKKTMSFVVFENLMKIYSFWWKICCSFSTIAVYVSSGTSGGKSLTFLSEK